MCKKDKMADESERNTSNASVSTRSIPSASSKKKAKPRGPYNQYLSQPEAKIPRTTLKKWPNKKFETASTSYTFNSVDDLCSTQTRSSAVCCGSFEGVCCERLSGEYEALDDELPCPYDDDNEQSFETQSDQCDLVESDVTETSKVTESEQATIYAAEDEHEDVEEYLDALDSDESAADVNIDQQEGELFKDVPLYEGAPISVAVSMLLIVTFAIRHSLTGLAVVDLLTLVSLHCALPNKCASSMDLLKKFFMKLKNPIQFHYYCTFCMEYQGLSLPEDKLCKNRCCLKDLHKKENYSYFIIVPLMCQLRDLIQSKCS